MKNQNKKEKLEKLLLSLPNCIKVKDSKEYPIKHLEIKRDQKTWFIQWRALDEEDDDEFIDTGIYMVTQDGESLEDLVKRTLRCLKKDKQIHYEGKK